MRAVGISDIGRVRAENEDAYLATAEVLAVADGMGGHEAGGLAARTAIAAVAARLKQPPRRPRAALAQIFSAANRSVREISAARGHDQMGTTLTVAAVRNGTAWIGHVGDSRAYLLRDGELRQLTDDHSLVGELVRRGQLTPDRARAHPKRNVITRAVGSQKQVKPDIFSVPLVPGDRLILCTDGLTGGVDDRLIADLAAATRAPQEAGSRLIEAANQAGGADNITVVIGDRQSPALPKRRLFPLIMAVVGLSLAGTVAWGAGYWLDHNFYLTVAGERVAINRGLPGSAAGYKLGRFEKLTAIRARDLPDYYQKRLRRELVVGGAQPLERLLDDLEEMAERKR